MTADHIIDKLENIISGHSINADDADWLRAAVQAPAEGDELTTGRQYLLTPEYGAAMVEMAKHYGMSVDNVLRAAIRLYQAQRFGSIKIEHVRDSKLFDPDVQPKGTAADAVAVPCTWKKPGESDDAWVDRITGAAPSPAPVHAPWTTERHIALREAHQIVDSDCYFDARPALDNPAARDRFEAGYKRGFDAAAKLASQAPAVGADDARDAARYRWLRDKANRDTRARAPMVFNAPGNGKPVQWTDALYESYLDEAMDVAMESNPPVQHKEGEA